MLLVLLPRYPTDANHDLDNWRSSVTFHWSTCVAAMSLLRLRNGPLSENGAFWSKVTGKMFVCPCVLMNGLSRPPRGLLMRTSEPHGGATDVFRWNWAFTNSNERPYESRTEVLPSPEGSHDMPTRGPRFPHCVFMPAWDGNPASPGKYSPAGAFGKTTLWMFWLKRPWSN